MSGAPGYVAPASPETGFQSETEPQGGARHAPAFGRFGVGCRNDQISVLAHGGGGRRVGAQPLDLAAEESPASKFDDGGLARGRQPAPRIQPAQQHAGARQRTRKHLADRTCTTPTTSEQ